MSLKPTPPKITPIRPPVPDGRTKKLFARQWLEIVNLAQSGVKVADIAKTYAVDDSVIYRGLRKRGVNLSAVASRLAMEEAEKSRNETLKKIRDTREKDYRFSEFIQQTIISTIVSAQKNERPIASVLDDIKALKLAMDGVRNGTDNKWKILGLDRENQDADAQLPELPIRDLTDEETEAMRAQQDAEDGLTPEEMPEEVRELLDDEAEEPEDDEPAF